jgi:hypothetical protein
MNLRHFQNGTSGRGILGAVLALTGAFVLAAATTTVPETPKANPHRADTWVLPVGEPALPEGDLAAPIRRHCALCHSFDYIATQPRLSRAGWTASVEKMRAKYGAPIPTNDVPALVNFLVKHHGKE